MKRKDEQTNFSALHAMIGILMALGFIFISFEWSRSEIQITFSDANTHDFFDVVEQVPITFAKKEQSAMLPIPKMDLSRLEPVKEIVLDIPQDYVFDDPAQPVPNDKPLFIPTGEEIINEPHLVVEHMPAFPGGEKALMKFLSDNIVYPELAKRFDISGRVYIMFVIEPDGTVSSVTINKGVDDLLDNEALRVVSLMPRWNPGIQNGKKVRVRMTIPVNFVLR